MTRKSLVVRRTRRPLRLQRAQKTKTNQYTMVHGFAVPVILLACAFFFSGWSYLFTINERAVQGQAVRDLERSIAQAQKDNTHLRIEYAELISLYSIEHAQEDLELVSVDEPQFVEEDGPLALK